MTKKTLRTQPEGFLVSNLIRIIFAPAQERRSTPGGDLSRRNAGKAASAERRSTISFKPQLPCLRAIMGQMREKVNR